MKNRKPTDRRNFLLAAGLGSAGMAAAVVAGGRKTDGGAGAEAAPKPTGYQASEHVLKYYKTTEV